MERIVEFTPAFDKRDPDPSRNYGVHGVELRMVLKGDKGAVQFVLFTNWMLPHVQKEMDERMDRRLEHGHYLCHPLPADLGYHWNTPRYEDQDASKCTYTPNGVCYYDGSSLNAERIYEILLCEGSEGVWRELEAYYNSLAGDDE